MSDETAWTMIQHYVGINKLDSQVQPEPLIRCPKCDGCRVGQYDDDGEGYGYYCALNPKHLYENEDFKRDENNNITVPVKLDLPLFSITVNVCHNCRFMWNPEL